MRGVVCCAMALSATLMGCGWLGVYYSRKGDYGKAEVIERRELAACRFFLGEYSNQTARALTKLGAIYINQGRYKEAVELLLQAVSIRRRILDPDHPDVATSLNSLALAYDSQGEYGKAVALHHQALAIVKTRIGPEHPHVAASLNNFAYAYAAQGEYAKAVALHQQALAIRKKRFGRDHPDVATSLNGLANAYAMQGEYGKAVEMQHQALAIVKKRLGPDHPYVAASLNNLANVLAAQGEYGQAIALLQQALAIKKRRLGPEHPDIAVSLMGLANTCDAQGEHGQAVALSQQALVIRKKRLGPEHPHTAAALFSLARTRIAHGLIDAQTLALVEEAGEIQERHLRVQASGMMEQGWDRFYYSLEESQARLHEALPSAKTSDPGNRRRLHRLLLRRVLLNKGRSQDEAAQLLQTLRRNLTSPNDRAKLDRLQSLQRQRAHLYWHPAQDPDHQRTRQLSQEIDTLEQDVAATARRLRLPQPPSWRSVLPQVAASLRPQDALVEYLRYRPLRFATRNQKRGWEPERYVALVLTQDEQISLHDIGLAAPLDQAIERLRGHLSSPSAPMEDTVAAARQVYDLALAPLESRLRDREHVFVSPDGELHRVPFAALHDGRDYLLGRQRFSYLTSGRSLLYPTEPGAASGLAVFANPDLRARGIGPRLASARPVGMDMDRAVRVAIRDLAPLPGTEKEAHALRGLFPSARLFLGAHASEAALLGLRPPGLLHIATHGLYVTPAEMPRARPDEPARAVALVEDRRAQPLPDNPMARSVLILAGAQRGASEATEDGIVNAQDVTAMDLRGTQLVVLSACQTGLGQGARSWQGPYGLRRAFQIAGAETVVSSLWQISDEITRELMTGYYQRLLMGSGRAAAMDEAALALRQRHPHPYHWAPFTVTGRESPLRTPDPAP